jgi:anti-sigma factor RsiW
MTNMGRLIGEEDLHAYVDDLLAPERRAWVDRYLRSHPEAAERVTADAIQRRELRAVFAARAAEPIPAQLSLTGLIEARLMRRSRISWHVAAALLVVSLALGVAGGWWWADRLPSSIDTIALEAAASYRVYAIDQHRPVEIWAPQKEDLARWVSARLNRSVIVPTLRPLGYQLLGGRLVASPGGAAALFVYEGDNGKRLVIYLRPVSAAHSTPIEALDRDDLDGCVWIDTGIGYSVIADESYQTLLTLATYIRKEISNGR